MLYFFIFLFSCFSLATPASGHHHQPQPAQVRELSWLEPTSQPRHWQYDRNIIHQCPDSPVPLQNQLRRWWMVESNWGIRGFLWTSGWTLSRLFQPRSAWLPLLSEWLRPNIICDLKEAKFVADSREMLAAVTFRTDGTVTVEVFPFLLQYPAGSSDSDIFVKIITCN